MNRQSGLSVLELLATLAILAVVATVTTINLEPAEAPLQTGSRLVEGAIQQARSSAIATTSAYRVRPGSASRLVVERAGECDDADWIDEPRAAVDLPDEVTVTDTGWSVCFTRRGIANDNVMVTLVHPRLGSRRVEVFLGGATRVIR
jgi:prepilin-type N-terminal cleavage/methylation domain-containing protein